MKNQQGLKGARRLCACQLFITAFFALLAILFVGTKAALSAVLGGLVCVIPSAYFARKLFYYHGAQAAKEILRGFYWGEALKFFLSVVLFTLVFKFFNISPLIFFAVYIVTQMVFWFSPLIFIKHYNGPESD